MKIYFSPFSPFVRKCLLSAHELGLAPSITLLASNAHPVQRDRDLIGQNPLGKVPTLITDEGDVLYDSRVICEYLNALAGGKLFPSDGPARWQALKLQALGDGILDGALLARYEEVARPEALRWPQWREAQLDKATTGLSFLENNIDMLRTRVDIGVLTVSCALWYLDLRFAPFDWRLQHTQLAHWYEKFSQRPSMQVKWSL